MRTLGPTPPRGRCLAWEAGELAGVSGTTIGQWARRGYIRSSVSSAEPRVYAFQDVAEAIVVRALLDRGVSHAEIRHAIGLLEGRYGRWPLSEAPIATVAGPRRARVVVREDDADYDVGDRGWQQLLGTAPGDALPRPLP